MGRNNHRNHLRNGRQKKNGLDIRAISLLGVEARGETPWVPRKEYEDRSRISEIEYAYNMSLSPIFRFNEGTMKGKPDYQRIASELNCVYHNGKEVRDRYRVRSALYKFRKKKELV